MDDSSSDESFYITQSSTRSESSRRDIDDCSFETTTLLDTDRFHQDLPPRYSDRFDQDIPPRYSDRFHQDSCFVQMTDFKVYRLWNMTAILYLPT